jgi:uncharacterized SAM-binding protein YcdF (DUF218 family)
MMLRAWVLACRVTGALTLAAFFITAFTTVPNRVAWRLYVPPDIRPADAIVVLAVSANPDESLGTASLQRALAGIQLYREGLASRIVFLGMHGEAEARARLALSLGVDRGAILTEGHEPTTRHEAERMRVVLHERLGLRSVLLVTDVLHMRRARALFERAGFAVRPATMDQGALAAESPEARLRLTRTVGEELAALGYYKLFHYL